MKTNIKLKKANKYRLQQERLRNKALRRGVNLIAPETIFLSEDTFFGSNVTIEPYVVINNKVKIQGDIELDNAKFESGSANGFQIDDVIFKNGSIYANNIYHTSDMNKESSSSGLVYYYMTAKGTFPYTPPDGWFFF